MQDLLQKIRRKVFIPTAHRSVIPNNIRLLPAHNPFGWREPGIKPSDFVWYATSRDQKANLTVVIRLVDENQSLKSEIKRLKEEALSWKDAWYEARRAIGSESWKVPNIAGKFSCSAWNVLTVDPEMIRALDRAEVYRTGIHRLLNGFFFVLSLTKT